ncbi:hypothetical protein BDP27DRAFT_268549 [Rhodocollybia butyracea]|uniref:Anti-proliferative protein domain-containing protein n=1 Tax=Rhodocollybia butyracea TaxID=206335 RepID=A0A9P5UB83_9AGAR|nr:hypothetical protein BDP27DRAFT_268549 [Rhodocollybia butyracea]
MAFNPSTSLSVTLAHAISYLTRPLIVQYSATTIIKLQLVLEANLTALYAPTWVSKEPLRGSGRRCLTLSPECLPPRVIYSACLSAGVQWFDWIALLGGKEFDFFVDPGCVSVRHGRKGSPDCKLLTVWADEIPSPTAPTLATKSRTIAQQLMESEYDDEEQIFAMIAEQTKPSTQWVAPSLDRLTIPSTMRSSSPFSTDSSISASSSHSRSSSRSSNSSSGFSYSSSSPSDTTVSSTSSPKQSRRERARQARVFVDTTKTEVTPYDGGKTTVLTGGVMLGGSPVQTRTHKVNNAFTSQQWRQVRV